MSTPGTGPHGVERSRRSLLPLIALPVVAMDVIMTVTLKEVLGDAVSTPVILAIGLALAAPVVLLVLVRARRRRTDRVQRTSSGDPAPWLRRAEWASGRIPDATGARLAVSWLFAVSFSGLSIPLLLAFRREFERDPEIAFGLVFPLAALGLTAWAVRETLRWRRFGRSLLVLHTLPGVVGGPFRARLQLATSARPEGPFEVRLWCVRRVVTGSGKNRSTRETPLWEDVKRVPPEALQLGPTGTQLELAFTIPFDCRPSDPEPSSDQVLWRLSVDAPYPGVDFSSAFEVPVFRTPESSEDVVEAPGAAGVPASLMSGSGSLAGGAVRVRPWRGGRELYFPPGRNALLCLLGLAFGAAFCAVWLTGAPLFMRAIFVLLGGAVALASLAMLLQGLRVRVDATGVEVRTRYLFFGRTRRMEREEIDALDLHIDMHSNDRVLYDVRVVGRGPGTRKLVAGTRIRGKTEAQAIAAVIADSLGLASSAAE